MFVSKSDCNTQARVDPFIESKADELARLQKDFVFQGFPFETPNSCDISRGRCHSRSAVDDLVGRLQRSLSAEALGRAVKLSDEADGLSDQVLSNWVLTFSPQFVVVHSIDRNWRARPSVNKRNPHHIDSAPAH